jgi:Flp pilus assembly protein TadG
VDDVTTDARHRAQGRRDCDGDLGTAVVELTLLTPLILLIALFVIACGRCVESGIRVSDAAHQAARAASLARFPAAARKAADSVIAQALPVGGASCRGTQVAVDTSRFQAGGSVTVTVSCSVSLADLSGLPLPTGATTQTASFTSPIDTFRSTT